LQGVLFPNPIPNLNPNPNLILTLIKLGGYESHLSLDFCLTIQGFVCLGSKLSFSSKVVA